MAYILRTPFGTFTIEPDETAFDMMKLCIGGMWLASFEKAEHAAFAVKERRTGWPEWDRSQCEGPDGIDGWEES